MSAPIPTQHPQCVSCSWWVKWRNQPTRIEPGRMLGECRKRAPRMFIRETMDREQSPQTRWPATQDTDFCGEHKAAERGQEVTA